MLKARYLCLILLTIPFLLKGQVVLENAPAAVKWDQINTNHFKVLFPRGFNKEAMRVANTLQHLYAPVSKSMGIQPRKISVLLQNENSISNGFVTLAPRRSEFFTMPPQDYKFLGTNDWLNLLSVHEFRHVVQNDKGIAGFNKLVYWVLGEYALSGMQFISVPNWFGEGDAVGMETALTHSGRGRISSFNMALRTSFLENGPFNYHKQYLRSFKDFIPNHYVLGYHLSTYLRRIDEKNIWEPIVLSAYRYGYQPFNFSNSIKKFTGKRVVHTYNDMALDLTTRWHEQVQNLDTTVFERINRRPNNVFTNYNYPHALDDGSVVAFKVGLSDIGKFILISPDGTERRLFTSGIMNDPGYITVGGNLIAWTEYQFDPRWAKRVYSVIRTFDFETGSYTSLTKKTRYSGAAISPDGVRIVLINNLENGLFQMSIISSNMGIILKELVAPSPIFYSMPNWSRDGIHISALKHGQDGVAVVRIHSETGAEETLIDFTRENIGYPVLYANRLFYNSDLSGIDNIYAMDLISGEIMQVTSSKYGAFNPSIDPAGNKILYNDFTKDGMDIVRIPYDPSNWKSVESIQIDRVDYFQPLISQENNPDVLDGIPEKEYPVTPYSKARQLLKINSWGPYFSTSVLGFDLGVFFQDVLSLNRGFFGYEYNLDEGTGKWKFDYSYQGFYPVLDFSISTGTRKTSELIVDSTNAVRKVNFEWKESGVTTGVRIPLTFAGTKYRTDLSISNYVGYNRVSDFVNDYTGSGRLPEQQGDGNLISNNLRLFTANFLRKAKRDINSRWAQALEIETLLTPYGGDYDGRLFAAQSLLFFPGFFKHNSTNFLLAYQGQYISFDQDIYLFPNQVPFPRGYSSTAWENFYTMRTNYEFTIWNSDLAFGPVLNIQRIRTKIFYDIGFGETSIEGSGSIDFNYRSYGTELWFDFNFMRLVPLLSGGVRAVYVEEQGLQFQLVIGNIQI